MAHSVKNDYNMQRIAIDIGDDKDNTTNFRALLALLTGKRDAPRLKDEALFHKVLTENLYEFQKNYKNDPVTEEDIAYSERYHKMRDSDIFKENLEKCKKRYLFVNCSFKTPKSHEIVYNNAEEMTADHPEWKMVIDHKRIDKVFLYTISKNDNSIIEELKKKILIENEIDIALEKHQAFLIEHGKYPEGFIESVEEFSKILSSQSLLQRGQYNAPNIKAAAEIIPTPDDEWLNAQKDLSKKEFGFDAYNRIIEFAKKNGRNLGNSTTINTQQFASPKLSGYDDVQQKRLPSLGAYLTWHDDYRAAFDEGFKETYLGPKDRYFKTACDKKNPPFTDPVADMLTGIHKMAHGRSTIEAVESYKDRETRLALAENLNDFAKNAREQHLDDPKDVNDKGSQQTSHLKEGNWVSHIDKQKSYVSRF